MTNLDKTRYIGPPRASDDPNIARISAIQLSIMAKRVGRCGNINPLTGYVCVTQVHDTYDEPRNDANYNPQEHWAMQIGGPNDGYIYARWR